MLKVLAVNSFTEAVFVEPFLNGFPNNGFFVLHYIMLAFSYRFSA